MLYTLLTRRLISYLQNVRYRAVHFCRVFCLGASKKKFTQQWVSAIHPQKSVPSSHVRRKRTASFSLPLPFLPTVSFSFPPFLHMLQHSFLLLQSFCKKDGPYYPNLIPDFRNHTDLGNKEYLAYQHLWGWTRHTQPCSYWAPWPSVRKDRAKVLMVQWLPQRKNSSEW